VAARNAALARLVVSERFCKSNLARIPQGPNKNSGRLEILLRVTMQIVRHVRTATMREFICKKKSRLLLIVPAACGSILDLFRLSTARLASSCAAPVGAAIFSEKKSILVCDGCKIPNPFVLSCSRATNCSSIGVNGNANNLLLCRRARGGGKFVLNS